MSIALASPIDTVSSLVRPVSPALAFKDWSLVCAALGEGRQSLILRKGGIAEGRDGFRFKHESFFLFPTQFHQQSERIRPDVLPGLTLPPPAPDATVEIRNFFTLGWALWIDDWPTLQRLAPFHVWREEVVRERFEYGEQRGLQCAFGRVYRLDPVWTFSDRASFGGCRSWITLPEFPADRTALHPVMDDAPHAALSDEIHSALGTGSTPTP